MSDSLLSIFDNVEFASANLSPDDLFSIWESLESTPEFPPFDETVFSPYKGVEEKTRLVSQKSTSSSTPHDSETEVEASPSPGKRRKLSEPSPSPSPSPSPPAQSEEVGQDGQQRMMHITVERNRRKQMNEHLGVLRTLMPPFYVKRGDQASIIGGVVDYIKELQQVLQSLEAKKQRKVYTDVLSPRPLANSPLSPRPLTSTVSPRKPPMSPRVSLPASPRTPQSSPYKPKVQHVGYLSPSKPTPHEIPSSLLPSSFDSIKDLAANSKSSIANVEVKFSGSNVLVKTVSPKLPGQALKIITALKDHSLEILHVSISASEDTMLMVNSFTIKIGIECKLSAEELAYEIQKTFC